MAGIYKPTYIKTDSETGKKVKRKLKCWYIKYRDADGIVRRVKGFSDKEATRQKAAELERSAARISVGLVDRYADERQKPLVEHLKDFRKYLLGKGDTEKHVKTTVRVIGDILSDCGFLRISDLSGSRVQEWLSKKRSSGLSPRTCNSNLIFAKGFTRWLVRERRMAEDPFAHLSRMNQSVDVRRKRRVLRPEEFERLISAVSQDKVYYHLSGSDRAMLYMVSAYTGLRSGELASLTPASFNLDAQPPTVVVEAKFSKHRRRDEIPLRADLADRLRNWICDKPRHEKLWPAKVLNYHHAAQVIKHDLALVGIPYHTEEGTFDFHALRHHYITSLVRAGVHPKAVQTLARHSTITLTMDKYSHLSLQETTRALDSLPPLPKVGNGSGVEASGTGKHAPQHIPPPDISCLDLAPVGNAAELQADEMARLGTEGHELAKRLSPTATQPPVLSNFNVEKNLPQRESPACTPACTSSQDQEELAQLVSIWHKLAPAIKRAIWVLVEVVGERK